MRRGHSPGRRSTVVVALAILASAATAPAQAATAPSVAVKAAITAAQARFHTRHIHADFSVLSRHDRRWALVDGFATSRNRPWAAWLHNDSGTRWALRYLDTRAPFQPHSTAHGTVPCDLYPAFSEARCGRRGLTTGQIRSLIIGQLRPSGDPARIAAIIAHNGYTLSFTPPGDGTLTVSWRGRRGPKYALLARGRADFVGGRHGKIKITLTNAGRRAIARARHLNIIATATFTPIEGPVVTGSRTFTLIANLASVSGGEASPGVRLR